MFELSAEGQEFVKKELGRYEAIESAIIPSLYRAQSENGGWISEEVIDHLSGLMGIPSSKITEVFKFYTMFNQKKVGKYHVQVCTNISCAINGGRELARYLQDQLGVELDQVSADGRYTISRVECLGSCGTAPMMQVNDDYHEDLTNEKALELLKGLP